MKDERKPVHVVKDISPQSQLIFISYARKDGGDNARLLEKKLKGMGYRTWRDTRNIRPDKDFTAELEKAIDASDYVIACITEDSTREDSFVRREIQWALLSKKPVIVARFKDVTPPISVLNNTWVDFYKNEKEALTQLRRYLKGSINNLSQTSSTVDPFRNYLEQLIKYTTDFLNTKVVQLIELKSQQDNEALVSRQPEMLNLLFKRHSVVDKSKRTTTTFESFVDAYNAFNGRLLLLGEPGSGKTITLIAFARDAALKRLENPTNLLPVFGVIPAWIAKREKMEIWLASNYDLEVTQLRKMIKRGEVLLLLDGLDELGHPREEWNNRDEYLEKRKAFIKLIPKSCPVVVSSRKEEYYELNHKLQLNGAVTLKPLSDAQIKQYLKSEPDLWASVVNDKNLKELLRSPLIISLFAFAFRKQAKKATKKLHSAINYSLDLRDEIIREFIDEMYNHEARRVPQRIPFSLKKIRNHLGRVALRIYEFMDYYALQYGGYMDVPLDPIPFKIFVEVAGEEEANKLVDFAIQLKYVHLVYTGFYRFSHAIIRDYFAFDFVQRIMFDEKAELALRNHAAIALADFKDERSIPYLIKALDNPNLRYSAGRALNIIWSDNLFTPRDDVVDAVVGLLGDDNWNIRMLAFGRTATSGQSAFRPLMKMINHSNPETRRLALQSIWNNKLVMDPSYGLDANEFFSLVKDPDPGVRRMIARILEYIEEGESIEHLQSLMMDEDSDVRNDSKTAYNALIEKIKSN